MVLIVLLNIMVLFMALIIYLLNSLVFPVIIIVMKVASRKNRSVHILLLGLIIKSGMKILLAWLKLFTRILLIGRRWTFYDLGRNILGRRSQLIVALILLILVLRITEGLRLIVIDLWILLRRLRSISFLWFTSKICCWIHFT